MELNPEEVRRQVREEDLLMPLKHGMKMETESKREEGDTGETVEGLLKQLAQMSPNCCCQMHWPQENGDVLS